MTNQEILQIAMEQSAIDAGCQAEDFRQKENKVILSQKHGRARKNFGKLPFFCSLISYGNNVIASVDARIADAVGSGPPGLKSPQGPKQLYKNLRMYSQVFHI
ncbi:MAG: hypothetical protein HFE66_07095 [Clostridiales bacterium]|jgi:hypothetical protein|nr:hypothetical protein [Clostridiales bacterium]